MLPDADLSVKPRRGPARLIFGILVCLVFPFLLYYPALRAPFIFDDKLNIVNNPDIKNWEGAPGRLMYRSLIQEKDRNYPARPVAFFSFMLNYRWGGLNPVGYRLVNIALHSAVTLLVFLLMRWVFLRVRGDGGVLWPLGVALLFAAHPIQTEVVTYISNRTDSLATLFYLLSIWTFILSIERSAVWLAGGILLMVIGWFSKEIAISLPVTVLVLDWIVLSGFRWERLAKRKWHHLAFWSAAIALVVFRKLFFGKVGFLGKDVDEIWTSASYFSVQLYVALRYLFLLVAPWGQSVDHFIPSRTQLLGWKVVCALAGYALVLVLGFYWYLRLDGAQKLRRVFSDDPAAGPHPLRDALSLAALGALWMVVTLAPTSSFFPAYDAMVERRLYLPSIGFFLLAMLFYHYAASALNARFPGLPARRIFAALLVSHLVLLSFLTLRRNRVYMSAVEIWKEAVALDPANTRAQQYLGVSYYAAGNRKEALRHFLKVLELSPRSAAAFNNIGSIYYDRGDYKLALEYFSEAVSIDPNLSEGFRNQGDAAYQLNDLKLAEESYWKAIELDGDDWEACNNLGLLYLEQKKYPEAEAQFFHSIEASPSSPDPFGNLGDLYAEAGFGEKALDAYRKAAERGSKDPELPSKINEIQKYVDSLPKVIYKD